jgi:hypothetical protein
MSQITWNITAGNSSPGNDAAAAVFITSAEGANRLGVKRCAKPVVSPTRHYRTSLTAAHRYKQPRVRYGRHGSAITSIALGVGK